MKRLLKRRTLQIMLFGVLLYGLTAWLTSIFPLNTLVGGGLSIEARPGVVVPLFFGLVFGPEVGFVTGAGGNLIADFLAGRLVYPPDLATGNVWYDLVRGYNLNWHLGNGLMGLIPGLLVLFHCHYRRLRDQLLGLGMAAVGIAVGMGVAVAAEVMLTDIPPSTLFTRVYIPIIQSNFISAVILLPVLLFNYEHLDTSSLDWLHSGIMRKLMYTILLSAGIPLVLFLFLIFSAANETVNLPSIRGQLLFIMLLVLLFTVVNAGLLAQNMSRSLFALIEAAHKMEAGQFTPDQAAELEHMQAGDELGHLIRVFSNMAREVIAREQTLKEEIRQLHIEIDEAKRQEEVNRIVESDFFQDLQAKAADMRQRRRARHKGKESAGDEDKKKL